MSDRSEKPFGEISVVYPAYNEEENLRATLDRSLDALESLFERFELIVVDDGSTDRTLALLEDYARRHPQVRVLRNEKNLGAGASMWRGMKAARYDLVINNAMDYPFDLHDLKHLCPLAEEADVVVAARSGRPGYTLYRHLLSAVNRWLLRLLFRLPLRDCNFVQLYRRRALEKVNVESRSAGFLPAELIMRVRDQGFRTAEVPVKYHPRRAGRSVMGRPRVVLVSLYEMLRFWVKRLWRPSPPGGFGRRDPRQCPPAAGPKPCPPSKQDA